MNPEILTWVLVAVAVLVVVGLVALTLVRRRGGSLPSSPVTPALPRPDEEAPEEADLAVPAPEEPSVAEEEPVALEEPAQVRAPAEEGAPAPVLETPEPSTGRLVRLRERLARSGSPLGSRLLAVLSRDQLSEDHWDELEETLLLADVGAGPTAEIVDALRTQARVSGLTDVAATRAALRDQLVALVDPRLDRALATTPSTDEAGEKTPAVVLVVGVNGTGKTTTIGKLARLLVADGTTVVLGAADTFRAAAADQLQTWGSRVGVTTVRADRDGADPASVAFDAVRTGTEQGADVVLLDTAGRLQNKTGLMDELGKIVRVASRQAPLSEVLLVLDATTGQNGLSQARVFAEVAGVTGIVLTKLDGTAKGGIVVAVQRELGVPVKLVGLGEGPDDLAPFDPEAFVDGLLGE
ncbi:MAG: signal recognition particle-docking protein FtsY [Micrococcales bacterium]|nr:signal recognition particle-docking protein FtsY [Micrococcales bacterium]